MSKVDVKYTIPLLEPEISGNEWKYLKDCLDTGWVSSVGEYVNRFEETVADYLGVKHAVAVVNGTCALHVSLLASGVRDNDEVIVPTLTFVAPVNTVRYCGAYPIFMDCDKDTLCLDVSKVIEFIRKRCQKKKDGFLYNKKSKRRIKAIIPVHVFGHPADMDELRTVSKENNIEIIEDATESLGSEYKGKKTGSIGRIGCLSFNGNKVITTGGGGMIVTNSSEIAQKIKHLTTQAKKDPFEYFHDEIGFNYRLTNLQAAMGVAQMEKLEEFLFKKRENALLYRRLCSRFEDVRFFWERPYAKNNFWLCTVQVPQSIKRNLMSFLLSKGIQVRPIWQLIHTLPMYKTCETFFIEAAAEAYKTCFNLPSSSNMRPEDVEYVAAAVTEFFDKKYSI